MKLDDDFKALPPLVFELRIFNLVPYDSDICFDNTTLREMDYFFSKPKHHGDFIVARIALTIQETIFTSNFHALKNLENVKTSTIVFNLKQVILSRALAVENNGIFDQIKQLAIRAKLIVPEYAEEEKNEPAKTIIKPKVTDEVPLISYVLLKPEQTYDVRIGTFKTPDFFFIMLLNRYDVLEKLVSNYQIEETLKDVKLSSYCIYKFQTLDDTFQFRAQICDEKNLTILLLDVGLIKQCSKNDLYEIPKEFYKEPFTAVLCKLEGIKPKREDWDRRSSASFKHLVKNLSRDGSYSMKVSRQISEGYYEVSLISQENQKDVARAAIKANYAKAKGNNKETALELASTLEKLLRDGDAIVGSSSDLFPLLGLPETTKIIPPENVVKKENRSELPPKILTEKSENKIEKLIVQPEHFLRPIYQHPYIDWYQSKEVIGLKIDARETSEYSLDLTETTVTIFMVSPNVKKFAHIVLYGSIQPKFSSHSRKSENEITIRLAKRLNVDWPRLTSEKEKNNFITFKDGDMPEDNPKQVVKTNYLPADYYDLSETDGFKDYDDQLNCDDIF